MRGRLPGLLDRFRGLRVMVVGDLVLDHYLVGDAGRISREYPVMILNHERDEYRPGGAANTVANLAALGATVVPAGWIGTDLSGDELVKILGSVGCDTDAVVRDPGARTVTKTRIVAGGTHGGGLGQHLLRVDQLGTGAPGPTVEDELARRVERLVDGVDGFVLSDYDQGTLTQRITEAVTRLAEGRYVGLDSRHRLLDYAGVSAATPNLEEAAEASGLGLENEVGIEEAGTLLRAKLGAEALLITRGGEGMSLFEPDAAAVHIPVANKSEVFDVTGAGDTVVAVFTLARLAGGSYLEAAHLANVAGGISVRRAGATPVSARELRNALTG
ncbi:MAG: ADP-heptose synthase / D-glycero-beta-D-manno-heptose 7-phosphate kinase [uncultured Rubrobacteraceae bacterium]|uniref:ADP-heptose synthase / D-glycero-beta-D-manno-heptose 7-phosphate kinase n=1 Tax=uncultured Rubrobacteraceae bacterium TaxID=349277 RepID=A0A6J4QJ76_9ACTN|nr:MAG: ADP-heptose synthase / D-glycero-beta-D-manno-heptose 7-phosphate kinase [uncultured Rubrobacteraceae bacterium]